MGRGRRLRMEVGETKWKSYDYVQSKLDVLSVIVL